jgi:cytosine/adenosine deaminase-related metal-dependent hydrolase
VDDVRRDGVLVVERGRVAEWRARPPKGSRVVDPGGRTLVPGLVCAHSHLVHTHLAGATRRRRFAGWIRQVLASPAPAFDSTASGARALLSRGVTALGDHDPDGSGARAMEAAGLRGIAFREFLAFDPARGAQEARAAAAAARRAATRGVRPGLAPHAPYTVAAGALREASRSALPISIHLAETEEEREWLGEGTGPLEKLLRERGRRPSFPVPRCSPVDVLEKAGLLRPGTLVVHANALSARELGRLARARCIAVHCPGTHGFFRRGDPPIRRWRAAGLRFALGTDSLASNDELDLLGEMSTLRAADPSIPAAAIVDAVTRGGAVALGLRGAGSLRPGSWADFVSLELAPQRSASDLLEALVHRPRVASVHLARSSLRPLRPARAPS